MLGTESLDGSYICIELGGTGISPPDKNPPGPGHPTSGDIFYCIGSRQLNHSSFILDRRRDIFKDMDAKSPKDREFYSSSLAPLQLDFVCKRIGNVPNVKNLIRLVKHWRRTHLLQVSWLLVFL